MWSVSGTRPHVSHGNVLGVVAPGFRQQLRGPDGESPKRRRSFATFVILRTPLSNTPKFLVFLNAYLYTHGLYGFHGFLILAPARKNKIRGSGDKNEKSRNEGSQTHKTHETHCPFIAAFPL